MLKKPKQIPSTSGVYFFKNLKGKILYIGKAKNLSNRLSQHPMLKREDATNLEWQETGSEIEALILESRFIKKYKPKYNISLRDDKQYIYVIFTEEVFPRIYLSHQEPRNQNANIKNQNDNAKVKIIGPFTESRGIRLLLAILRKLYPYCTCKQKHDRPCLNANIGLCLGVCCLANSKSETLNTKQITKKYKENIKQIKAILTGRKHAALGQRMFQNIKVIQEIAGRESALDKLAKLFKLAKLPPLRQGFAGQACRIEGYDISNIQGRFATGSMIVFENGYPNKSEYRKFKIRGRPDLSREALAKWDDTKMLSEMLERRFRHIEWPKPDLLLIDGGKGQLNAARSAISNYELLTRLPDGQVSKQIPIISIAKGKQEVFSSALPKPVAMSSLPTAVKNLIVHIDEEAHRFAITYYRKLHKKAFSGTIRRL